jgi:hypothetical protein
MLIDAMRALLVVVGAGDGRPGKHDRQPFFAYALRAVRGASATPLEKGNKKVYLNPRGHERGPTAPAADSSVDNFKSQNVYSLVDTIVSTRLWLL